MAYYSYWVTYMEGRKEEINTSRIRINIIKDEKGNKLTDPHSVLNRWKNCFNQVLNVHGVHDVTDGYTYGWTITDRT
jgi:hypothetical protein